MHNSREPAAPNGNLPGPPPGAAFRLRREQEQVVRLWAERCRENLPAASAVSRPALLNSLPCFLGELASALEANTCAPANGTARSHGTLRAELAPYDLDQLLAEYGYLREVLFEVLRRGGPLLADEEEVILRTLQLALREATAAFLKERRRVEDDMRRELARNTDRLRRSEERYELAGRATRDAIWDWNFAEDTVRWNEAIVTEYGYGREALHCDPGWWYERIHPADRERVTEGIHRCIEGSQEYWTDGYRFRRADGDYNEVQDRGYIVRDEAGRALRMIGAIQDQTEERRAQATLEIEKAFLQTILEQLPEAIWILEAPSGRVVVDNPRARVFLKQPVRAVETMADYGGYPIFHLDGRPYEVAEYPGARAVTTGETVNEEELRMELPDGSAGFARFSAVPIRNLEGEIIAAVVVATDITAIKQSEVALRTSVDSLTEERSLRERFTNALTHDLRNPLTAAKMAAQLALKLGDETRRERQLGRIVDAMDRADRMIGNLLDANRIKAGERLFLELGDCDLAVLAGETVEELAIVYGDRFRLEGADSLRGHWSCDALRRVTENLVGNAVKYGMPGTVITVRTEALDGGARLSVHNVGNELSEEEVAGLFRQFGRTRGAEASGKRGWGIGLTLVKGLAEAHGGSAGVRSRAGEGTTFYVNLPFRAAPPAESPA